MTFKCDYHRYLLGSPACHLIGSTKRDDAPAKLETRLCRAIRGWPRLGFLVLKSCPRSPREGQRRLAACRGCGSMGSRHCCIKEYHVRELHTGVEEL
jgi:hypothetical protein